MPKQVRPLVEAVVGPHQVVDLATNKLLHIGRVARAPDHRIIWLQTPLLSLPSCDGEGDVKHTKGNSKGSEDGEKAKLDRDALWAVMTKATCCSKQPPSDAKPSKTLLLFCHLEEQLLDTGQSSPDEAKE